MYLNQVFEFSMVLDNKNFQNVLAMTYDKINDWEEIEEYRDNSFASKGITVLYRNSQYKKKIKLIVNSAFLLNNKKMDSKKLIKKSNQYISKYFNSTYVLDDFNLTKVVFLADIDVGSIKNVFSYIKVLQRIGKVKGFSPSDYEHFNKNNSFCLDGNSNGIEFAIYNLKELLVNYFRKSEISYKKQKCIIEDSKNILRTEIRLTKQKTIRAYTNQIDDSNQVATLLEKNWEIFLDIFTQIIPFGDFYKKNTAIEIIQREIKDTLLKRRMLRLITLIPEKKSLLLAQKALNYRRIDDIMKAFEKINLSPITISKRQDVKYLENLYFYLFNEN